MGGVGGIGGVGIGGDACINETGLDIIGMTVPNLRWQAADCGTGCVNPIANICTPDCTADSLLCPGHSTCLTELNRCSGRDSLDCLDDS